MNLDIEDKEERAISIVHSSPADVAKNAMRFLIRDRSRTHGHFSEYVGYAKALEGVRLLVFDLSIAQPVAELSANSRQLFEQVNAELTAEFKEKQEKQKREIELWTESRERSELARLKAKYEGNS